MERTGIAGQRQGHGRRAGDVGQRREIGLALGHRRVVRKRDLRGRRQHQRIDLGERAPAIDAHAFEVGDKAGYIEHAAGEWYEYHYGGGGGWGDPLARPAEKVLEDVLDEYVSVEGARREYGVVLTGSLEDLTLAVDRDATARLRAERRTGR